MIGRDHDLSAAVAAARAALRAGQRPGRPLQAVAAHVPAERSKVVAVALAAASLQSDRAWLDPEDLRLRDREVSTVAALSEGRQTPFPPASDEGMAVRALLAGRGGLDRVVRAVVNRAQLMRHDGAARARVRGGGLAAEAAVLADADRLLAEALDALVAACEVQS